MDPSCAGASFHAALPCLVYSAALRLPRVYSGGCQAQLDAVNKICPSQPTLYLGQEFMYGRSRQEVWGGLGRVWCRCPVSAPAPGMPRLLPSTAHALHGLHAACLHAWHRRSSWPLPLHALAAASS